MAEVTMRNVNKRLMALIDDTFDEYGINVGIKITPSSEKGWWVIELEWSAHDIDTSKIERFGKEFLGKNAYFSGNLASYEGWYFVPFHEESIINFLSAMMKDARNNLLTEGISVASHLTWQIEVSRDEESLVEAGKHWGIVHRIRSELKASDETLEANNKLYYEMGNKELPYNATGAEIRKMRESELNERARLMEKHKRDFLNFTYAKASAMFRAKDVNGKVII